MLVVTSGARPLLVIASHTSEPGSSDFGITIKKSASGNTSPARKRSSSIDGLSTSLQGINTPSEILVYLRLAPLDKLLQRLIRSSVRRSDPTPSPVRGGQRYNKTLASIHRWIAKVK